MPVPSGRRGSTRRSLGFCEGRSACSPELIPEIEGFKAMHELLIKNMVCFRCILAVENLLKERGITFEKVTLGKALLQKPLSPDQFAQFEQGINHLGFEVLKTKEVQKIERIKNLFHQLLMEGDIPSSLVVSQHIRQHIPEDYTNLSQLFSSIEGITIEKYFINLKIEKSKELLFYQEKNISEIAYHLGYSSVQHLSAQFKKVTGMTPTAYKQLKLKPRKALDQI